MEKDKTLNYEWLMNNFQVHLYDGNNTELFMTDDVSFGNLVCKVSHTASSTISIEFAIFYVRDEDEGATTMFKLSPADCIGTIVNTYVGKIVTHTFDAEGEKVLMTSEAFIDPEYKPVWTIIHDVTNPNEIRLKVDYALNGYRIN